MYDYNDYICSVPVFCSVWIYFSNRVVMAILKDAWTIKQALVHELGIQNRNLGTLENEVIKFIQETSENKGQVDQIRLYLQKNYSDSDFKQIYHSLSELLQQTKIHYHALRNKKKRGAWRWVESRNGLGSRIMQCQKKPISRAPCKLFEILGEVSRRYPLLVPKDPNVYLDIAGAPGAWAHWLCHRPGTTKVFGYSLLGSECGAYDPCMSHCQNFTDVSHKDFGGQQRGDVLCPQNQAGLTKYLSPISVAWVVADVGIQISSLKHDDKQQVSWVFPLTFATIKLAVHNVTGGGCILIKYFNFDTTGKWDVVLHTLQYLFEKVILIKPVTSSPTSDEAYLVALNRNMTVVPPLFGFESTAQEIVAKKMYKTGQLFDLCHLLLNITHMQCNTHTKLSTRSKQKFLWYHRLLEIACGTTWWSNVLKDMVGKKFGTSHFPTLTVHGCLRLKIILPATTTHGNLEWNIRLSKWMRCNFPLLKEERLPNTLCCVLIDEEDLVVRKGIIQPSHLWTHYQLPVWGPNSCKYTPQHDIYTQLIYGKYERFPVIRRFDKRDAVH
jgi:23S rRNA U2552 (ribose-2'-O)-methylase RlmE/FtsJ